MFSTKLIMSRFADYFAKHPTSNLSKLISIFSDELQVLQKTNETILEWRDIDKAQGKALDLVGENVNQPRGKASDEVYRILLKSKIARNMSDGSINAIIHVISIALSTDPSAIKIVEKWNDFDDPEPAAIKVIELPLKTMNKAGLDPTNFTRIVQCTVAAGIKVGVIELSGTFEFGTTAMEVDNLKGFGNINGTVGGYLGAVLIPSTFEQLPI
ncbi:DUF2612 domain-containing protein [Psychrobacillus lasiicapitis]|uniref:DUF2612 domain-containing protein n=1 Tax=Psychrobacillus lasiicapitis TaxID=1636719 RepID=A0A544TAI7_9BACI|nr:DUF2612 domain-containing protein [Psychrobacillus lasiicapitis]TQR14477.1 DUF2612 domain-containing protein [Psychrobacillus lasiicapitis]GGA30996.1 hypothetical protein GCM10011384_20630 [Psychrobacillus lasiicapitis]